MTYEDKECYTLCDIHYMATTEEANAVSIAMDATQEMKDFTRIDMILKMGHFDTSNQESREYLEKCVNDAVHYRARASVRALRLINEMALS
tara:strand:- start:378 stop:650 length:273 start_codon:yes stop_codon:yes gene_type:complete